MPRKIATSTLGLLHSRLNTYFTTVGALFGPDGDWGMHTPLGPLHGRIQDAAVFARFDDVRRAHDILGAGVNQFSGKWNYHFANSISKRNMSENVDAFIDTYQAMLALRVAQCARCPTWIRVGMPRDALQQWYCKNCEPRPVTTTIAKPEVAIRIGAHINLPLFREVVSNNRKRYDIEPGNDLANVAALVRSPIYLRDAGIEIHTVTVDLD